MPDGSDSVLVFGPFRLFPAQRRLEKDGKPLRLGGRALDILTVLAERAGEVVSNRALLESVWQDVTVEESSLRFHIKNLRKILGDGQSGTRYVSTRAGITLNGNLDLAAFVNNVTNSTDLLDRTGLNSSGAGATFGRGGCTNADCTAYGRYNEGAVLTGFRPRTFGISIDYRF